MNLNDGVMYNTESLRIALRKVPELKAISRFNIKELGFFVDTAGTPWLRVKVVSRDYVTVVAFKMQDDKMIKCVEGSYRVEINLDL